MRQGKRPEALEVLRQMEERSRQEPIAAASLAILHAWLGNLARAMDLLEQAWADRLRNTGVNQIKTNPLFDPLREEPRFQALLRKMALD